jgi:transketolase
MNVMENNFLELEEVSLRVRERMIRMATQGGCFLGASLSCADLFVYLYRRFLRFDPRNPKAADRDYLLLSKGHDVPALYSMFVELGNLEESRLERHLDPEDCIYWHPNRGVPGVEFHSGSLGHLLSVGVGLALDCKLKRSANRVVVMTGDGELNEGSNWEALLVAHAYGLSNLTVVVDRNGFQANRRTEELIPLEPLPEKFTAFGASARRIDGHSFSEMDAAFSALPYGRQGPSVIVADTCRGKGLPSIENRADRWFCNFSQEEIQALLSELHGGAAQALKSETIVAR